MTALRVLTDMATPGRRAPSLMVLLPGALQTISQATDGSIAQRLESLLVPARQQYRTLWLGGVSLGGFMALAHAARHPGCVDGLFLLSPYPGNRLLTGAIEAAGGPAAWAEAEFGTGNDADDEEHVWRWLARHGQADRSPEIHFAHADADRFAGGQRLMAQLLPAQRVELIAGGHDWPSWRVLWNNFLDRSGGRFDGQS